MGAWIRRGTIVVVVALIATLTAAMPAMSQANGASPAADPPALGGPIPDDAGGLEQAPDVEGVVEPGVDTT